MKGKPKILKESCRKNARFGQLIKQAYVRNSFNAQLDAGYCTVELDSLKEKQDMFWGKTKKGTQTRFDALFKRRDKTQSRAMTRLNESALL